MNAGDIYVETHVDNEGFEDDLDDLVDIVEDKGEDAGDGFAKKFGDGASGVKDKIENVLVKALAKATGLGNGLVKTLKIAGVVAGALGASLAIAGIVLGALALGVIALGEGFKQAVTENQQMMVNLQYIVWAITQALQPAVSFVAKMITNIINLLIKALQLVALLIYKLTGKNIFANASADKFAESLQKADNSSAGIAGNLKEVKKQLAGFDEMNVLNDTSSGGGGGVGLANADFSTIKPDFDLSNLTNAETMARNIIGKIKGLWGDFIEWINRPLNLGSMEETFGNWGLAVYGFQEILQGFSKFIEGFFKTIEGLWKIFYGTITGDVETIKKGWDEFFSGLKLGWEGILLIIQGIMDLIVGLVWGAITTIWGWIQKGFDWITEKLPWLVDLWNIATALVTGDWDTAMEKIVTLFNEAVVWISDHWEDIEGVAKVVLERIWRFLKDWFLEKIKGEFKNVGTSIGDIIGGAIKGVINGILNMVETKINDFFRMINSAINVINKLPGVKVSRLSYVSIPRLAKGGIINTAGKGVVVGGGRAIAGENGAEAYLPLQDSQVLDRIADAIGNRITINANIVNSMNGKVISRELQRIQNENDFAMNR